MPKANANPTTPPLSEASAVPSRRALLAGSTAALVAGAVVAAGTAQAAVASPQGANDDAVLIALCDRQIAVSASLRAIQNEEHPDCLSEITLWSQAREQRLADADASYLRLTNQIAEIPAATHAGLCAKAHAMMGVLNHIASAEGGRTENRLTLSLTRDVLAIAGRTAA